MEQQQQTDKCLVGSGINPMELDEVLEHVIKFLLPSGYGKKADLLNCRLANARWNEMVVHVMKKEGASAILRIDLSNIKEYQQYLHDISARTAVRSLLPVSTLSLVIAHPDGSTACTDETARDLIDLLSSHKNLSVSAIKYKSNNIILEPAEEGHDHSDLNLLWQLINLSWATLKTLDITDHNSLAPGLTVTPVEEFPQLRTLTYHTTRIPCQPPIPNPNRVSNFLTQLLQSSPQLRELSFTDSLPSVPGEFNFIQSQRIWLILSLLPPSTTNSLTFLEITLQNEATLELDALCALQFQQLETLKIIQKRSLLTLRQRFRRFLASHCPALRTFEVTFMCNSVWAVEGYTGILDPGLPPNEMMTNLSLQALNEVEIRGHWHQEGIMGQLHQAMAQAPGLDSITLNWTALIMLVMYRRQNLHKPWVKELKFPTLTKLVLKLSIGDSDKGAAADSRAFTLRNNFHVKCCCDVLFPNVTNLTFVMDMDYSTDSSLPLPQPEATPGVVGGAAAAKNGSEPNLTDLISIFLSTNPIRELEIQNYYEDWLAEIAKENSLRISCLTHLKLTLPPQQQQEVLDKCACEPRSNRVGFDFGGFLSAAAGAVGGGNLRLIEIDMSIAKQSKLGQLEIEKRNLLSMTEYLEFLKLKFPKTHIQFI